MEMIRQGLLVLAAGMVVLPVHAQQRYITVASTTSTEQSGLFKNLLPIFENKTGIRVRVVALGTGQALDMGKRGDADVVFVHARPLEEKFVAAGFGVKRFEVMYNDFVLIGPKSDPAKVAGGKDVLQAFREVKAAQAPFVSRGDKSGTHFAELEIWKLAGVDIPKLPESETSIDELKARIAAAIAFLNTIKPAQIDGTEDKTVTMQLGPNQREFKGQALLLGHSLPNFFFHATTAYNLLRQYGVEIGKRDFMGPR